MFDLKIGVILVFFYDIGIFLIWKDRLKSSVKGYDNLLVYFLRIFVDMLFILVDFVLLSFVRMFLI